MTRKENKWKKERGKIKKTKEYKLTARRDTHTKKEDKNYLKQPSSGE